MQDPTTNQPHDQVTSDPHDAVTYDPDADGIRVKRPEGLTEARWARLKTDILEYLESLVEEVVAARDPQWCVMVQDHPGDQHDFHLSRTVQLADYHEDDAGAFNGGYHAWVTQDRDPGARRELVVEGPAAAGTGFADFTLLLTDVSRFLNAVGTPEAREALWDLIEEVR